MADVTRPLPRVGALPESALQTRIRRAKEITSNVMSNPLTVAGGDSQTTAAFINAAPSAFTAGELDVSAQIELGPESLEGEEMLMPGSGSSLRRDLDLWFERNRISPRVIAEFDDRALMKAFGERGAGVFTTPTAVENDVLQKYGVEVIGRSEELTERFYLISAERHIKNPAVSAITEVARNTLFQQR